ncbi:MAG: thermonuclease family protein [Alphaproteobacteria bacterium]|nr:thermonuclease family protein [Alphaproteobacteria bacterium SS10]
MPTTDKPLFFNNQRRNLLKQGLAWGGVMAAAGIGRTSMAQAAGLHIAPPEGLQIAGQAEVVEVVDGDTVFLSTGQEIRLVGIQAPKIPLGRPGFRAWPLGEEAREALEKLLINQTVRFGYAGASQDRHGRGLAHLVRDDGLWVQGWMLREGHARVYSFPDNRSFVSEMMALEQAARIEQIGIWALDFYAIRDSGAHRIGPFNYFQLVEGVVTQSTRASSRWYINFGEDYREDFTAVLRLDTIRRFPKEFAYLPNLAGSRIRVRGWLYLHNGPAIDVSHPEQIEFLA